MERDFLGGIGRKEQGGDAVKVESPTDPADCAAGAPAVRWQFQPNSGAAPAFMSFGTATEDASPEFSISGFRPPAIGDAFDVIKKHAPSPATPHQRQLGFEAPATVHHQQYGHGALTHHLRGGSRMVQAVVSPGHPAPFNQASPLVQVPAFHHSAPGGPFKNPPFSMNNGLGGATVGPYGGRNPPRGQNAAQLTIFYNGSVNVFDNVPVQKAQELMLLASRASVPSPPSAARKSDSPIRAASEVMKPEVLPARQIVTQKSDPSVPHLSTISSPIPVVPLAVTLPRSTSNCTTESSGPKPAAQAPVFAPTSQASSSQPMPLAATTTAANVTRVVPQARKASLARFLEKRKERVTSVEPYPSSKSLLDGSDAIDDGASTPSKSSSSTDLASTSNKDKKPVCFGQHRNISFSSEVHPGTRLQI